MNYQQHKEISMNKTHTNVTIWEATVDALRDAAAAASLQSGDKVSQVKFMHDAVMEKIERDGITEVMELVRKSRS
jgi:hypothetical protein